jgi:hypothetical protein
MKEERKVLKLDLSSDEESSSDESYEKKKHNQLEGNSFKRNPTVQTDKLAINVKYASEYDKRKRRQEYVNSRQDQAGESDNGSDESSSESEDEDAELLTAKVDLQILKVRNSCFHSSFAKTCLMIFFADVTTWHRQ